jgi:Methyltransferase domain
MAKKNPDRKFTAKELEHDMESSPGGYGKKLGQWWVDKAGDDAHRDAYRHIARWLKRKLDERPDSILDYACGAGHLLKRLRKAFPDAELTGYDGSGKLLKKAHRRLKSDDRLELVTKILPDLEDDHERVDLSVLCLPHLLPLDGAEDLIEYARTRPKELLAARKVAKAMRKEGFWERSEPVEWQVGMLLFERTVARHLSRLTRPGGHCARIDYSQSKFSEVAETYQDYLRFSQGACASVCGVRVPRFFRLLVSTYADSELISDVSDQTDEYDDEGGGYMILLLTAVKS